MVLSIVSEHSQRSFKNGNDVKEMKGTTETFRRSFIPNAINRYNNNQNDNNNDCNNDIADSMAMKPFDITIELQLNMLK